MILSEIWFLSCLACSSRFQILFWFTLIFYWADFLSKPPETLHAINKFQTNRIQYVEREREASQSFQKLLTCWKTRSTNVELYINVSEMCSHFHISVHVWNEFLPTPRLRLLSALFPPLGEYGWSDVQKGATRVARTAKAGTYCLKTSLYTALKFRLLFPLFQGRHDLQYWATIPGSCPRNVVHGCWALWISTGA
jgi:hypothetical protein